MLHKYRRLYEIETFIFKKSEDLSTHLKKYWWNGP